MGVVARDERSEVGCSGGRELGGGHGRSKEAGWSG